MRAAFGLLFLSAGAPVIGCAGVPPRPVPCDSRRIEDIRARVSACETLRRVGFHEIMEQARRAGLVALRAGMYGGAAQRPLLAQSGEVLPRLSFVLTEKAVESGVVGEVGAVVEALCQSALFETLLPLVILLRPNTIAPEPPIPDELRRGTVRCSDVGDPPLASFPDRPSPSRPSPESLPPATPLPEPRADGSSRCLPCTPVVAGGIAYEYHSAADGSREHDGMAEHTHHFRMNQSPPARGCICFWDRNFRKPTAGFSPLPGAVPVQAAGGGGIAR